MTKLLSKLLRLSTVVNIAFFLQGCIGSALFYDDNDYEGEFGSLHSIPDRPPQPNREFYRKERMEMEKTHRKEILNAPAATLPKKD